MQGLVREAMREGALGVGSSLIYAPAFYAKTDELVALMRVAAERGADPENTILDLVIGDGSRVQVIHLLMSEENVAKAVALPWVSFGSDAGSLATEGHFLNTPTHPRAYGNFARVPGKYVREEKVLTLEAAIRKLSLLPATNLGIEDRGALREGYYADVVIFDPEEIRDHATFADPHRYATGMVHVFVNGEQVLAHGEHTGALPGRVVRGPGWEGWPHGQPFTQNSSQSSASLVLRARNR